MILNMILNLLKLFPYIAHINYKKRTERVDNIVKIFRSKHVLFSNGVVIGGIHTVCIFIYDLLVNLVKLVNLVDVLVRLDKELFRLSLSYIRVVTKVVIKVVINVVINVMTNVVFNVVIKYNKVSI